YYDLLRSNDDMKDLDIDALQECGILVDKEDDTYLLQKFIKPISDRPFFIYEIVQRTNGYNGFALKNINVLKKAEEMEVMKLG
ncbi:MAG TPA: 4-hydroxyphenylpyruvate dioxygenase, partial [Flavipsychrobacter sp.]|nr:4-hydroxyphenylpyruvate dioxygenase [Flavipsychrobacter sp.]